MAESWKDRIIGGVIAIVVAVVAAMLIGWWSSSSDQSGLILFVKNEYSERTRSMDAKSGKQIAEMELFAKHYEFFNLKGELKNFDIIIPLKTQANSPIFIETENQEAVITSVSSPVEISMIGSVKIRVKTMRNGGQVSILVKSPSDFRLISNSSPSSDIKSIQLVSRSALHILL